MGANLFAKTVVQKMHFWRMYRPFREQVRSYARRAEARCSGSSVLVSNHERGAFIHPAGAFDRT
ncbi:hypothetical protein DNF23_35215 [Pseudomonas syringae pv. pisi]